MEPRTQIALLERALAQQRGAPSNRDEAPLTAHPIVVYTAAERYEHERAILFRRYPLVLSHASRLSAPGSVVTTRVAGVPVLITRDHTGTLRAFLNVCRHRGARVETAPCRHGARHLTCPLHGWRYALSGALEHTPSPMPGLDREGYGLVPLSVGEAFGVVFAVPTPGEPMVALDAWLGELGPDLDALDIATLRSAGSRELVAEVNWKLALEALIEARHLARHALEDATLHDHVKPHHRCVFPRPALLDAQHDAPDTWSIRALADLHYVIFPNTLIRVRERHVALIRVEPEGLARSSLHVELLARTPDDPAHEASLDALQRALHAELHAAHDIQLGLTAGANRHLTFGRDERPLTRFHKDIREALASL